MRISEKGLNFIKSFEGCDLVAKKYKGEKYYTIGYGHYGEDVKPGQIITQQEADNLLRSDMASYEKAVERQTNYLGGLNQNEFDALTSFCYNLGEGNLNLLTGGKTRNKPSIADHITAYYHSGNPANDAGLLRRRKAEKEMFLTPVGEESKSFLAHLVTKKDGVPLRKSMDHGADNVITYFSVNTPVDLREKFDGNWGRIDQGYINLDDFEYTVLRHVKTKKDGVPLRSSASHTENNVIMYVNANTEFDILEYSNEFGRAIQGWLNLNDCE